MTAKKSRTATKDAPVATEEVPAEEAPVLDTEPALGVLSEPAPLTTLFDLSLPVAVELGRAEMTVDEVLKLGRGSVIELDRLAGEPVDIFVGDRRFAEAEVVVVGENFGVRITRLLATSNSERA